MSLPTNFQFSPSSLQDFNDCPRRFQLKYLENLSWPAPSAEPALEYEEYLQLCNNPDLKVPKLRSLQNHL